MARKMSANERLIMSSRVEEMLGKDWSYNRIQKETQEYQTPPFVIGPRPSLKEAPLLAKKAVGALSNSHIGEKNNYGSWFH